MLLSTVTTGIIAQPSAVKSAAGSVFTLTTFKQDGSLLASSHGVFVSDDGMAIGLWSPFVGAATAVVIDAKGNRMNVESIMGANDMYDVCKFKVNGKSTAAKLATVPAAAASKVWLLGYSTQSKPDTKEFNIQSVEKFMDKYSYYIFSTSATDNTKGCPLVNASGQVIGLLQQAKTNTNAHSTDANFINTFVPNALSINNNTLRRTGLRTALPASQKDAQLTLMLASERSDSLQYVGYIKEFISKFPTLTDGYTDMAQLLVNANQFDAAASEMQSAITNAEAKDEAHSDYAKVIYQKELYKQDKPYAPWSFDKALDEAKQAYAINPQPIYQHQQAQIIFAQSDYKTAYDMFMELSTSSIRNGEIFYEAAQCQTQLKAPAAEIMALLDSAVNACPKPLDGTAAPYVLARGAQWQTMSEFRKAVIDYNQYDSLMYGRPISSEFYYNRELCEVQIHQYQQALNDIARAILMSPDEPTYWAENASLNLRLNLFDNAIKAAQQCVKLAPDYTDGYIVLGVAQIQNKEKAVGLATLQKAKELGDKRADDLITKYK